MYFVSTELHRDKPYWKNDETWVCPKHVPTALYRHSIAKCWFKGCTSTRPAKVIPQPEPPPVSEGPSVAERRRGATSPVPCGKCGVTLWRRPAEINGKTFVCTDCRSLGSR